MKRVPGFSLYLIASATLAVLLVATFGLYVRAIGRIERAYELRLVSYQQAGEPRRADDDLPDRRLRDAVDSAQAQASALRSAFAALGLALGFALWRTYAALREGIAERKHLAAIVDSCTDAIIGKTLDGAVTSWNAAAEQLFGYLADEIVGQPIRRLIPAERLAEEEALLARIARREPVPRFDTVRLHRDGRVVDVALSVSPIEDAYGRIVGASSVVRDIGELKRQAAEIRALNAELERRIARRTADLEASNQELEAFAYSVSHDLRAPLRTIDGFAQALLEDYAPRLDDEGRDCLRRVREAAQHMGELIDAMLELSRATRGELEIAPVDLSAIAESTLAELRRAAPERAVTARVAPGVTGWGDARLLGTVLQNLIGNAWKFTARVPAARIEFDAEHRDGELLCRVRDNGAGFDNAYADNLFGPFQRLHRTADFPGHGIGLATVKRVIARMGGRVSAEGAVGQGATFTFTLPDAGAQRVTSHA